MYVFLLQRFYSISSSPDIHRNEIHITAAVVEYKKRGKSKQKKVYTPKTTTVLDN